MTKDEMLDKYYYKNNYNTIQSKIKDAMLRGEHSIILVKESYSEHYKPDCVCLDSTKEKLMQDGFEFTEYCEEWEIKW